MRKQNQYRRIKYVDGLDKSIRTIDWYREKVFNLVETDLKKPQYKRCLDIGSGNGRINKIISGWYKHITCLDPVDSLHEEYAYKNVESVREHLQDYKTPAEPFDVVLLIDAFKICYEHYEEGFFDKMYDMTRSGSRILMVFHLGVEKEIFPDGKAVKWFNSGTPRYDRKRFKINRIHVIQTEMNFLKKGQRKRRLQMNIFVLMTRR